MNKKIVLGFVFILLIVGVVSAYPTTTFLDVARENFNITGNIETMFIKFTEFGDDKGIRIEGGQFSVGTPDDPRESVFGGGDSTTKGMIALHYNGSSYTDVTSILSSDNGSSIGLFGSESAGNILYIGSDFTYGGVKAKVTQHGTVEPDNVIAEYWNSTDWDSVKYMAVDSDFPYTQHANILASHNGSQQWRFGLNKYPWIKSTINGEEKYWGKFSILSDITTDPLIEQLKLHTNRFEINANGFTEYYGNARYSKDVIMHWHLTEDLEGFSPISENIDFADGLSLVYTDNEFQDGRVDGRGGYIILPEGIDTSIPLIIEVLWEPLSNNAGNVEYEFIYTEKRVGDYMTTTDIPFSTKGIETININEEHLLKKTSLTVDISKLLAGEIVGFGVKRDATPSNNEDTFNGNVAIINIRAVGYFWKP